MNNRIIPSTERFSISDYPELCAEVAALQSKIAGIQTENSCEIIISFLKDHTIRTEFIASADAVATLIRSSSVDVKHLEDLFVRSRNNKLFQLEFEEYLKRQLANKNPIGR